MRGLRVLLLGRPRLEFDGQPVAVQLPTKQQALLFFLSVAHTAGTGPVSRSELATLLWEELDAEAARGNLRVALTKLRRALPGLLQTDSQHVGFSPDATVAVDLVDLMRACDESTLPDTALAAAQAWRGPPLDGFGLASENVERWLAQLRRQARQHAVQLRHRLAQQAQVAGQPEAALGHLRALLDIDDADETAHMAVMDLLAASGRRTAAIAQYETCRAALADRLGARPSAACYALYTRIHADSPVATRIEPQVQAAAPAVARLSAAPATPAESSSVMPATHTSGVVDTRTMPCACDPADGGTLIGRAEEVALLALRLSDPECRWLTVIGPGGVGKTRLAQAAADRVAAEFRHGVLWLSGRDPGGALRDPESLAQQVLACTGSDRDRRGALLLVLDNMETVHEVSALARLLQTRAPGVVVLATSRRRLGVGREWLLELSGLSLARSEPDRPASSPAAQLLSRAVQRLMPGFDPDLRPELAADAETLCAHVGGLPLALELAARSIQQAGLASTVRRLQQGAPLEDPHHGTAERHHSIAVVIDDAWHALPEAARESAIRLAWLPGAFDVFLAEAVGVPSAQVGVLREHSWLRQTDGELSLHPLQQDHLRRLPLATAAQPGVRQALADHVRAALPTLPPFGDWPGGAGDAAALARSALWAPSLLAEVRETLIADTPAAAVPVLVDALTALLAAAERSDEARGVWERAARRSDLPTWRRAGWTMRAAEFANRHGDVVQARRGFLDAMGSLGLADPQRPEDGWRTLPAASWRTLRRQGWPPAGAERDAFVTLLLRSMMLLTQIHSFGAQPRVATPTNLLTTLVAYRGAGRTQQDAVRVMSAYGSLMFAGAGPGRFLLHLTRHRQPVAEDPLQQAFCVEGECATRIALGEWAGLPERLLQAREVFDRHGDHRHWFECLSLPAKLAFYQGRLHEAYAGFAECTEHSLRRPGGVWRAWGPFGQAESALCLGSLPLAELQRLADMGAHWLTEMENVDTAYGLRHLGLAARLALRAGDLDRAREAVLAGAATADRIPDCSFWVHEGLAGLGDSLLALRRLERSRGGVLPPLDAAWEQLEAAVARHVRRFPAGAALLPRLRGERWTDDGQLDRGRATLRSAVKLAEGQGLRVELARACEALNRAGTDTIANSDWGLRARQLWQDMGANARAAQLA